MKIETASDSIDSQGSLQKGTVSILDLRNQRSSYYRNLEKVSLWNEPPDATVVVDWGMQQNPNNMTDKGLTELKL